MRAAMRALLPDFSRLSLKSATGVGNCPPDDGAEHPSLSDPVEKIWNGLTPLQQQTVIELLETELQRKKNDVELASAGAKEQVIKAFNRYEPVLPSWLCKKRAWKRVQWEVVLSGPEYKHLFTAPEPAGFNGPQMGVPEPNRPRDYADHNILTPHSSWGDPDRDNAHLYYEVS
jgi:hypothetical protein